jgi:hypothetical protein
MDLRPLVPWVFSQLGDQPDGIGRPSARCLTPSRRTCPASVIAAAPAGRDALVAGRHANDHGLAVVHLRIVYGEGKIFIFH